MLYIKGDYMKERFYCPSAGTGNYTTDECGVCFYFWDCKVGLTKYLEDKDFEEFYDEIIDALKDL
jgi:hypothetical protein